jgi:uncharacterized metal-binding protein YceD (DUF177 family)
MSERERRDLSSKSVKARLPGDRRSGADAPWSFPVPADEIPAAGRHVDLKANADERAAVARAASVVEISRLEASFDLAPFARDGVHVAGMVCASVTQTCVVTLEPMTSEVEETVDLVFMPPEGPRASSKSIDLDETAVPDILENGIVDLGAVAVEFLILGLDPYPRKPGVAFDAPPIATDPEAHPFAALAALKKDKGPNRG